jgi:hypothetical protein
MQRHKLDFGTWPENEIAGFGFYSDLQVLSLVYQLNKHANFKFSRLNKDLCKNNTKSTFNFILFGFFNKALEIEFRLMENRSYIGEVFKEEPSSLFSNKREAIGTAVANKEGFNYFLWLESEEKELQTLEEVQEALSSLKTIRAHKELSNKQVINLKKTLNY